MLINEKDQTALNKEAETMFPNIELGDKYFEEIREILMNWL